MQSTYTKLRAILTVTLLLAAGGTARAQSPSLYELANGVPPDLGCGPAPVACPLDKLAANPNASGFMDYRYVPLCTDGSGDHEWTLDANNGRAPTCGQGDFIRCVDGTRPVYYYDKAVNAAGDDIEVDDWVFYHEGGANCAAHPALGLALGDSCGEQYFVRGATNEMSSATQPARRSPGGVLSDDLNLGNGFTAYNRVFPWKCTFDKYTGNSQHDTATGPPAVGGDCDPNIAGVQSCRLWFHGRRLWQAMFQDLRTSNPDLRDLGDSDAPRVVLTGNSNGASGLTFNIDGIADLIRTATPDATVLGVLDNHFNPALEGEAAYDPLLYDTSGDGTVSLDEAVASGITQYDYISSTDSDFFPTPVDEREFVKKGDIQSQYSSWWGHKGGGDTTCAATHTGRDRWHCFDEEHVLFNHITTPVFIHQTLEDEALQDKAVDWYPSEDWDLEHWKRRIVRRMDTWLGGPVGACAEPREPHSTGVFMRNATQHVNIVDSPSFFDRCLEHTTLPAVPLSYHDAVLSWVQADTEIIAIEHGLFAGTYEAVTVPCPP